MKPAQFFSNALEKVRRLFICLILLLGSNWNWAYAAVGDDTLSPGAEQGRFPGHSFQTTVPASPIWQPLLPSPPTVSPKRIYIAPDDHDDLMWSGTEST